MSDVASRDWLSTIIEPFCPPVAPGESEELRRQYRAVVIFVYLGITIVGGFARLNAKLGNTFAARVQFALVVIAALSLLLNKRGYVRTTAHLSIVITSITIGIGMWTGGGMEAAAVVFLPVLPVIGLLTVGRGGGVTGAVQAVSIVVLVATLQKLGFEPRHDPPDKLFIKRVAESLVVVLQVWIFCGIFFRFKHEAFQLLESNRDELAGLFDSMAQAVLAFDRDGKVSGRHSAEAETIFARSHFENAFVADLLYGGRPEYDLGRQEFEAWLEAMFLARPEELADTLALAPSECVRREGRPDEQHLRLEFRPILRDGHLSRVMLLVTDDTERVRLQRAADEQKAARSQVLSKLRRTAAGGARPFLEFLRTSEERLSEISGSMRELMRGSEVDRLLRLVHTVGGEARVYDLDDLAEIAQRMEESLAKLRSSAVGGSSVELPSPQGLKSLAAQALEAVREAREAMVQSSPIGAAILDQVTVSESDLRQLWDRMQNAQAEDRELAARLLARPFGETVGNLFDATQRWCEQEGKRATLNVQGKEVRIEPVLGGVLPGVLTHLVRNAVAHGIETEDVREQAHKPLAGVIEIVCAARADGPVVEVRDDGAGLDVEALRRRAEELGVAAPPDPVELVFVDGLSTAPQVNSLRGRGVGMSAVRADLAKVGYTIRAHTERGRGTVWTLEPERARASAAE